MPLTLRWSYSAPKLVFIIQAACVIFTQTPSLMIWFDIKQLELKLKAGDMSDQEFFNYLLANMILYSVVPYISSNGFHAKWFIVIEIGIALVITVLGTKMTFNINSSGDNKDYFKRFFALSFVVAMRLLVIFAIATVPIALGITIIGKDNIGPNEVFSDVFDLVFTSALGLLYYYMLTNSFKRVSQQA